MAWACLQSGLREFEELYKFNLTVNNDQCMLSSWWLHNRPYQMGPVICLLVRVAESIRGEETACDFIAGHKGPSNPFLATKGQWRHDMVSTNMALNLVHTSDDPISAVREFRVFGSAEHLIRAVTRGETLSRHASNEQILEAVQSEFRSAADLAGYPLHDLDLVSNFVRLKLRLLQTVDGGKWMSGQLVAGFGELLRAGGSANERWAKYQLLCDRECAEYRDRPVSEVLDRLASTFGYRPDLGELIDAETRRHRLPYTEWERIVIETTLFFHEHLPLRR